MESDARIHQSGPLPAHFLGHTNAGAQDNWKGAGPACLEAPGHPHAIARAARPSVSPPLIFCQSLLSQGSSLVVAGLQQVGKVQCRSSRRSAVPRRLRSGAKDARAPPATKRARGLRPGPSPASEKGPVRAARLFRLPRRRKRRHLPSSGLVAGKRARLRNALAQTHGSSRLGRSSPRGRDALRPSPRVRLARPQHSSAAEHRQEPVHGSGEPLSCLGSNPGVR
ncbi:hypothetical protein NDU88_002221 [Pleurodeles waltl]|uniref:Uncharacterized protein n=1 Tax=Pleurodeles waltl TaxID=8319 RepID=A0AAV7RDD0_PLEWA|nr:hypothetical protein NDU88_002221 [Pleurodeles waltl]